MSQPSGPSDDQALLMFLNMVEYLAHWSVEGRARFAAGDLAGTRATLKGADTLIIEILALHRELMKRL